MRSRTGASDRVVQQNDLDSSAGLPDGTVATIGGFDGVHRGHQYLIARLVSRARESGRKSLVITFDPLPVTVLRGIAGAELTDPEERENLLRQLGVDETLVMQFSLEVARQPAQEFLLNILEKHDIRGLCVGEDFAFGHNREGNADFLIRAAKEYGFDICIIPRQSPNGEDLSSSRIRGLVRDGEVTAACDLLGHGVTISGTVVTGAGRGRQMGVPTANLSVSPNHLIPAVGIYAGYAHVADVSHAAAVSIGFNPTFGSNLLSVEAYLLDFHGDLVGSRLTLEVVERLRGEIKFDSVPELIRQMREDVDQVGRVLANRENVLNKVHIIPQQLQP